VIDLGVILAGGQGRRLGGTDKGALKLGEVAFHDIVIDKLARCCRSLIVVAPELPAWADGSRIGFSADVLSAKGASLGPAGGLLSALRYLNAQNPAGRLFTAPVDVPFFPDTLAGLLDAGIGTAHAAVAQVNGELQPVFGVWSAAALPELEQLVALGQERALYRIVDKLGAKVVEIQAVDDEFLNVNTPEDLARARILFDRRP